MGLRRTPNTSGRRAVNGWIKHRSGLALSERRKRLLCQFEKMIYPPNPAQIEPGSYMVALYRPCEKIKDLSGQLLTQVKAVGYCLPITRHMRYEMRGHWSKHQNHGLQFEVESYDEVLVPTREGIIAYLSSGKIRGIGSKIAERIYAAFGVRTLDVLDKEPERLLSIPGIGEEKLKKICDSYLENRGARDVVAFLAPHGITPNRSVKLYKEYGNQTMEIVRKHPYQLCEMAGIGFKVADKIAMSMGFDMLSTERVDEALLFTLTDAENKGHLCMEKHTFIKNCMKILNTPRLTEEMAANRAARLVYSGQLVSYQGNVYRAKTAYAETRLAEQICQKVRTGKVNICTNLDNELDEEERLMDLKLAPEQRNAVKMALTQGLSVITGGPGTGKTLIQKAILDIYRRQYPKAGICCGAPTGRAARRMEQSTGCTASTVHKALGLVADEDGNYGDTETMEADLILIDEVSMLDIYLAGYLFEAVKPGARMVLIGDADQLPSVGPGAVLSEIIASGRIPTVRLDKVFRQKSGSHIAINAKRIRHGNAALEYGNDFQFIPSVEMQMSAEKIAELYLQETKRYGIDNVALLTPYRQKTETGANALNERLRELVNPKDIGKPEVIRGKRAFRCGDKVMQIKNRDDVNNGDIGYIRNISGSGEDKTVQVDFGDGRLKEYEPAELDMLDFGYAFTVHKSQGSEYKSVIINLQCAHSIMLTRPLIYTAITRGKERVIIVGEKRALCIAVKRTDTEKRGTCLARRLQELL
ncbi:ATP-dependent RecD-like DNA helicase [Lachnospiraceae bacterium]|nr:ATP-dependent RecD-like DNA helicase [Lachnospiraceae bacterium]